MCPTLQETETKSIEIADTNSTINRIRISHIRGSCIRVIHMIVNDLEGNLTNRVQDTKPHFNKTHHRIIHRLEKSERHFNKI
ncbi:hypothetical protein CR513_41465, partial [Mucuna pruriens]